jgi:hypothetical protein
VLSSTPKAAGAACTQADEESAADTATEGDRLRANCGQEVGSSVLGPVSDRQGRPLEIKERGMGVSSSHLSKAEVQEMLGVNAFGLWRLVMRVTPAAMHSKSRLSRIRHLPCIGAEAATPWPDRLPKIGSHQA